MTVDDERPGFAGGQRRQACRYRTLHCHTQEPVRLCRRNRQSHRYWYLLFDFVTFKTQNGLLSGARLPQSCPGNGQLNECFVL